MNTAARRILENAIQSRVFPGATVDVGNSDGPLWQDALGMLSFEPAGPEAAAVSPTAPTLTDTPFDLASLTKPMVTAAIFMRLVETGAVALDERIAASFPEWSGEDRADVSVADLLEHASGLPARLLDTPPGGICGR